MNNSFTSYRYYPPAEFTPSTPPPSLIKHRNSSDLSNDHRLQNDCHTNYNNRNSRSNLNGEYLTSTSTCEPLNTLCTDTQFMRSTSNTSPQINNVVMKKNLQNNNNIIHNTPVFHGRQHSMPIFLPSFTKFDDVQDKIDNNEITTDTDNSQGSKEINRLTLISDGLPGPITTNIMSNSTIDTSTSIQKTNLTSPNPSSLNLVIDIRLHGLGLSDSNRMTQSCIQEQVYDKTMDDNKLLSKTNYIKCSMDELLTNLDYCTLRCKPHRANSLIDQQNSSSQSSSHELNTSGGNRLSQRLNKL